MPKTNEELAKVGYETFYPCSVWEKAHDPVKVSWLKVVGSIINRSIAGNVGEFAYVASIDGHGDWTKLSKDIQAKWTSTAMAILRARE